MSDAAAADAAMGAIFENYDPVGAVNGLFAPAYIKGYAPSEQAVAAWNAANRGFTQADLEATRMPNEWVDPGGGALAGRAAFAGGPYGAGRVPNNLSFGDERGALDPEALRVLAQGGKYNSSARRNSIAQRLAENAAKEQAYNASKAANPYLYGYY